MLSNDTNQCRIYLEGSRGRFYPCEEKSTWQNIVGNFLTLSLTENNCILCLDKGSNNLCHQSTFDQGRCMLKQCLKLHKDYYAAPLGMYINLSHLFTVLQNKILNMSYEKYFTNNCVKLINLEILKNVFGRSHENLIYNTLP